MKHRTRTKMTTGIEMDILTAIGMLIGFIVGFVVGIFVMNGIRDE